MVFSIFVGVSALSFLYMGGRNYQVIKPEGTFNNLPAQTQKTISIAVRYAFKVLAVLIILKIVLPMSMDIPHLRRGEYSYVEGSPSLINDGPFGIWNLVQHVTVDNRTIVYYFNPKTARVNKLYRFTYLPNSFFGLEIEEMN